MQRKKTMKNISKARFKWLNSWLSFLAVYCLHDKFSPDNFNWRFEISHGIWNFMYFKWHVSFVRYSCFSLCAVFRHSWHPWRVNRVAMQTSRRVARRIAGQKTGTGGQGGKHVKLDSHVFSPTQQHWPPEGLDYFLIFLKAIHKRQEIYRVGPYL